MVRENELGPCSLLTFERVVTVDDVAPFKDRDGLSFAHMFYHLYTADRGTFYVVLLITVAVFTSELLYFERDVLKEVIPYLDHGSESAAD